MGDSYASLDTFRAEYDIERTDHDGLITGMITSASRLVDSICRRRFYVPDDDEAIRFDFVFPRYLDFHEDLFSLTSILNGDGQLIDADSIVLYPAHGPPYLWVELKRSGNYFVGDGEGNRQCIHITGKWGYCDDDARPEQVIRATLMLTHWLYKNPETIAKSVGPSRIGKDDIMDMIPVAVLIILDPYIREWFGSHDVWASQERSISGWPT